MNNSKSESALQKLFLMLFSLPVSAFLTFFIYSFFVDIANSKLTINPADYLDSIWLYNLLTIFIPLLLGILIFTPIFISVTKITKNFPLLTLSTVVLIIVGAMFVFKPYKIAGGNVGQHQKGQTVLSFSRVLFSKPLKKGDVVVFKRSDTSGNGIGYIVGLPGDSMPEVYSLSGQRQEGDIVSPGFYVVVFGEGKRQWAIPESQVSHVVWYPFNKSKP